VTRQQHGQDPQHHTLHPSGKELVCDLCLGVLQHTGLTASCSCASGFSASPRTSMTQELGIMRSSLRRGMPPCVRVCGSPAALWLIRWCGIASAWLHLRVGVSAARRSSSLAALFSVVPPSWQLVYISSDQLGDRRRVVCCSYDPNAACMQGLLRYSVVYTRAHAGKWLP
jgi:hypothetical protein